MKDPIEKPIKHSRAEEKENWKEYEGQYYEEINNSCPERQMHIKEMNEQMAAMHPSKFELPVIHYSERLDSNPPPTFVLEYNQKREDYALNFTDIDWYALGKEESVTLVGFGDLNKKDIQSLEEKLEEGEGLFVLPAGCFSMLSSTGKVVLKSAKDSDYQIIERNAIAVIVHGQLLSVRYHDYTPILRGEKFDINEGDRAQMYRGATTSDFRGIMIEREDIGKMLSRK
jgi:hypothetical protein